MEYEGQVAAITGGASGIGRATALALARLGADIAIADVNDRRLAETRDEIASLGRRALAVHCDISKDADVESFAAQTLSTFGRVDILMNNAGVMLRGPIEKIPMADWEWILGINLFGVIRGLHAFLPHMIERGSGYVINTASIGGLFGGNPYSAPYITGKFGVVGLSEALFLYLRPKGIGVSVLCPGGVATNMHEQVRVVGVSDPRRLGAGHPVGTAPDAMQPDAVAQMVIEAMRKNQFLVFTHPETPALMRRKAQDIEAYMENSLARWPFLAKRLAGEI